MTKRLFDLLVSLLALTILSPLLLLLALAVKRDSPGPALFRQERVGLNGRIFRIHKFRTMFHASGSRGPSLTTEHDRRITNLGAFLRRHKLDELPQLLDVVVGHMSIVGPRPELPKYVALYPEHVREIILSVRPGLTDVASIAYRNESALLGPDADSESTYIEVVMPAKLRLSIDYIKRRSVARDLRVIFDTAIALTKRPPG